MKDVAEILTERAANRVEFLTGKIQRLQDQADKELAYAQIWNKSQVINGLRIPADKEMAQRYWEEHNQTLGWKKKYEALLARYQDRLQEKS